MSQVAIALFALSASAVSGCSMTSIPGVADEVPQSEAATTANAIDEETAMTSTGTLDSSPSWRIEPSPAGNPLQTATLSGRSRFGGVEAASTLVVGCRADADGSTLTLGFTVPESTGFDFASYEGPDGIGQTHPLLQCGDPDASPTRHLVGGWWSQPGTFMFGAKLPIDPALLDDLAQWPLQAGRELRFAILSMEKNTSPDRILTAHFVLPEDGTALETAISPCL